MPPSLARQVGGLVGTRQAAVILGKSRQRIAQLAFVVDPDHPRPTPANRIRAIKSPTGGQKAPLLFDPVELERFRALDRPSHRPVTKRRRRRPADIAEAS